MRPFSNRDGLYSRSSCSRFRCHRPHLVVCLPKSSQRERKELDKGLSLGHDRASCGGRQLLGTAPIDCWIGLAPEMIFELSRAVERSEPLDPGDIPGSKH